jgi:hypothetical protein
MDCDGLRWNGLQNTRRFKHPFTRVAPDPNHTMRARARSNRTGARAQNGAVRLKRDCVLETARQTVLRVQTRFGTDRQIS